jgi:hypothetical protein
MPQNSYQLINLTSNIILSWPSSYGSGPVINDINDVTTSMDGFTITFPDATLVYNGMSVLFNNVSGFSFVILANDGLTTLATVTTGQVITLYLDDNSSSNGSWRVIPFGGGTSSITTFTAESTDSSITITNGVVTPPSGTIDFQLPASITNLNDVSTTGFPVITDYDPLIWTTVALVGGDNISITNPDGITGNPIISLDDNVSDLSSLSVGTITLTSNEISATNDDDNLVLTTSGSGDLYLNGVIIDLDANVSAVNNLIVSGTFDNPFTPKAWVIFTDTIVSGNNVINIQDKANVASISGGAGTYTINFTNVLTNDVYGVLVTVGSTGGDMPSVAHGFTVYSTQTTTLFTIVVVDASGELVNEMQTGITVQVLSSA